MITYTPVKAGQTVDAAWFNKNVRDNGNALRTPFFVKLKRVATQSIPVGTTSAVSFDTLVMAQGATVSVPTTTITIPESGFYEITGTAAFTATTDAGHRETAISGTVTHAITRVPSALHYGTVNNLVSVSYCSAGDTIGLSVNHGASVAQTLSNFDSATVLSVRWLST